jgi:hypothetical protein
MRYTKPELKSHSAIAAIQETGTAKNQDPTECQNCIKQTDPAYQADE